MALRATAHQASSLLLLRASCALLRPLASPATVAIRSRSAKTALLKAALESVEAETGSRASAAALESLRVAADSLGTATFDVQLLHGIDSAIKSSEHHRLTKRTFEGEEIKIWAYKNMFNNEKGIFTLDVTVSKSDGSKIKFGCAAHDDADYITIRSMNMEEPSELHSLEMFEYDGFNELDENLHKSFYKYLELRGITPAVVNLVHEYMSGSGPRTHHYWLNKLSDFVKKD